MTALLRIINLLGLFSALFLSPLSCKMLGSGGNTSDPHTNSDPRLADDQTNSFNDEDDEDRDDEDEEDRDDDNQNERLKHSTPHTP